MVFASPAPADDPEPELNEPYIDFVNLPPEIDPGSGQRLFVCDLDSDHDPDVTLLAGGTVYVVRMVDMVASVQTVMTGVSDVCLVQASGGPERLAMVTSTGLWTAVFNPAVGLFESELLAQGVWQGALLVHARASALAPEDVDYVGVASNGRTILFATERSHRVHDAVALLHRHDGRARDLPARVGQRRERTGDRDGARTGACRSTTSWARRSGKCALSVRATASSASTSPASRTESPG
jgi:hypothetical protein